MSPDYFSRYLAEIGREPLLSFAEERELGRTLTSSVARNEVERARLTLFTANLRLVVSIARRYYAFRPDFDVEEFTFVGNTGLIKAVSRYDPSFGVRFSTYATWWIRSAIQEGTHGVIRIPQKRTANCAKIIPAKDDDDCSIVHPTRNAKVLVAAGQKCRSPRVHVFSLEDPIHGTDELLGKLESVSPDPSIRVDSHITLAAIEMELTELERVVLKKRYGIGGERATLDSLARTYGVTREAIRRTQLRALARLRRRLGIEVDKTRKPSQSNKRRNRNDR